MPEKTFADWKEKYYPKSAKWAARQSKLVTIQHSLRKWEGMAPEILEKYGLGYYRHELHDSGGYVFDISSDTCSLCQRYYYSRSPAGTLCSGCPLYDLQGEECGKGGTPFNTLEDNYKKGQRDLVKLLRKAAEIEAEKRGS